ncbi:MAG: ArsR family transcriptional regulator [Xanthomonadales bacterium]|nr:ArsR family transcriptional regulator [Xanthomonadales bacterium]
MSTAKQKYPAKRTLARNKLAGLDWKAMRRSASDAASLLKGLANESRLIILCVLAEGECSVRQLNERVDLSQSALSQHLAVLREQGLVQTRRVSQTIFYRLTETPARKIIKLLHDIYCPV